ncbi:MAG: HAMP domain-containing sensor histidine kinase [Herbinix sp.]|nr:HAMP domain-containing sensor histidine kinase [Herbinix sp.]
MKHSLRLKITLLLTTMIVVTIFMTWFINQTFLSQYYMYSKIKNLDQTYHQIKEIYDNNVDNETLSDEDNAKIEKLETKYAVKAYIVTSLEFAPSYPAMKNYGERELNQLESLFEEYILQGKKHTASIKEYKNYGIYKLNDLRLNSKYIDLFGELGDGDFYIFLRSNLENIEDSAAMANKFLSYIGTISAFLGTVAMLFISKKFTKPILELSGIAKKMSDLDFEVKYNVVSKDEIGELGGSINALSVKLESTIMELKQANNELMTDIQRKTEIDEMRKEFLSNVSHELKTPISLIQGYAEGLKENINDDEESRDFYCEVIMDEANKMNNMVKKLLSLNELEFGNNQVNFDRFNIVTLIKSVLDTTEILFKQKEVALRFEQTEPVYVWADEFLIEQVVTNYISNALNHVSEQKIIEIKLIPRGDTVRVAVFNTGENIPEDELDKIWIKFYKVDKARTREYGGSGIGLSIVKAIMNTHNKECGAINRPIGVEFWFELDTKS